MGSAYESVTHSVGSTGNPITKWQLWARFAPGPTESGFDHHLVVAQAAVAATPLPRTVRSRMPSFSLPPPPIMLFFSPPLDKSPLFAASEFDGGRGGGLGGVIRRRYCNFDVGGGGDLQGEWGGGGGCD